MIRFVVRRLAATVFQLVAISAIAFFIFFVIADTTGATPAERFAGKSPTPERVAQVAHILGTDQPYWVQYGKFLWRLVHLDFGYSFQERRPVSDILFPAAATTASLVLGAAVIFMLVAVVTGVLGALAPRSAGDRLLTVAVVLGISVPVFWIAPMLSYLFGYQPTQGVLLGLPVLPRGTSLFPIDGYVSLRDDPIGWAHHLVLPWIAFSAMFAAVYARLVRALTIEQLHEDYVRTARAKGLGTGRILGRHVSRNVAPVVATSLAVDVGVALSGTLFVERVFGLPGLGFVGLRSVENLDYPLTVGVVVFGAAVAVLANTVVDVLQAVLDPRVRLGRA